MTLTPNWGRSRRRSKAEPVPANLNLNLTSNLQFALATLLILGFLCTPVHASSVVTNCTHQALIAALNTGGTISFTNDCSMALTNTIALGGSITIDSAGHHVTLNGNNTFRLLTIQPGASVTFIGLTLSGGQHTNGGALFINSGATVLATNCIFTANHAAGLNGLDGNDGATNVNTGGNATSGTSGTTAYGGALYNLGHLTLLTCQFRTNGASGGTGGDGGIGGDGSFKGGNGGSGGAGALAFGGAIYNLSTLILSDCTFAGNTAIGGDGGTGGAGGNGAQAGSGGNGGAGAPAGGAAIYSTGTLTVDSSTFAINAAQGGTSEAGATIPHGTGATGKKGADAFGGAIFSSGSASILNSTFFGNGVTGGDGGNGGDAPNGFIGGNGGNGGNATGGHILNSNFVSVVNCTFFGGSAQRGTNGLGGASAQNGSDGSPGQSRGGNLANGTGTFSIQASIVASNLSGANGFGTFSDSGYNVSSDGTVSSAGTSLKNTDPRLAPLADNTGLTATMALISGSPAIDREPTAIGPATDQRDIPRPQGPAKDVGAYELVTVPFIVTQPTTQTQAIGGTITFTVRALGDSLAYQWELDSSFIPGATNSSYTITNVDFPNQGNYDVIITNRFGSIVSDPPVTIRFSPSITQQPTNQTVLSGTNATFNVTANGDLPLTYQWYFSSSNAIPGATSSTLIITSPQISNAGPYSVVVSNPYGAATSSVATLTVNIAPIITNQPVNQTVATNTRATFTVGALGAQPLSYQWRINGTNFPITGTASAYSKTVFATNNGDIYDVIITNSLGAVTSATARLTVVSAPVVTGRIFNGPAGFGGVRVALTNVATGLGTNVLSEIDGSYTIYNLRTNRSTNILSASADCYLFGRTNSTPTNFLIVIGPASASGIDLLVTNSNCFLLAGSVTNSNGSGMPGVQITVTNSVGGFSTNLPTDPNGAWSATLHPGTYTVTPSAPNPCYQFNPASRSVALGPSSNGVSFQASTASLVLRGSVMKGTTGVSGVLISANGQTTFTDPNGSYAISNLCPSSYSIVPALPGFSFQPSSISTNISSSANNLNFSATPALTLAKTNGSIALAFPALTTSRVEASADLTNWTTLLATDNFSATTLILQFTDTNVSSFRTRYYRVAENIAGLPRILTLPISNQSLPLTFIPTPITNCQIVASTNLKDWAPVFSTNCVFSNAPFQFTDPQSTTFPQRYYRLSQSPGF